MKIKLLGLAATLTLMTSMAQAGEQTWDFGSGSFGSYGVGNTLNISSGGVNMQVTAWASSSECGYPYGGSPNPGTDPDPCVAPAQLNRWGSHLGISNQDEINNNYTSSPNHAIDNIYNGGDSPDDIEYEMVLLSFNKEVDVASFNIGWWSNDSDMSVLAYTGGATNGNFFDGTSTWEDLMSSGWDHINHYSNVSVGSSVTTASDPTYSQYWLIGAYNGIFGHPESWSTGNDAIKLAGLTTHTKPDTGTVTEASAPGMLAMLIGGALLFLRRRK
ncbi:exosortase-dependent surface protein XDP1 [Glaciecola sp. 1036]|uniref:exosortase-dependent surface protein XDP1 n=1 Tax=Alteromonadaceae TaxID=72275 RepID=UPI003CFE4C20